MSKRAKIWYVVFLFSFLPYLYLVFVSIFGIDFSLFDSTELYYGYEAVWIAFCLGCLIPVYPIVLLFQCIYGFVNRKKLTKKQKTYIVIIIAVLIGVILLASIGHVIREKVTIQLNYKNHKIVIEEYLRENYGEALSADMEIQMPNEITRIYTVKTSLLEYPFSVWLHDDKDEVFLSGFEGDYIKESKLSEKMSERLSKQWGLPEYAKLNIQMEDIDVKGYTKEELPQAVLSTCDYQITGLTMDYDCYLEENVVQEIKRFLLQWEVKGNGTNANRYFMFYVRINDEYYASIQAIPSIENEDIWTLRFDGYSDEQGTTIKSKVVELDLKKEYLHFY